jgi:hypothetical protein
MINKDSIHNTLRYLQIGLNTKPEHHYSLRKWQRVLWYAATYVLRTILFFGIIYLVANLIY